MEVLCDLNYDQLRQTVKNGDLIFQHGSRRRPFQLLIMAVTGSRYCHVGMAFWVTLSRKRRLMVVEAQNDGKRRIVTASFYRDDTFDVIRAPVPWRGIEDHALERVGEEEYSYLTALYVGLRELFMRKFNLRLPRISLDGEICSEFMARLIGLPDTNVSPQGLFTHLTSLPNK
jgi:hypothetical protein